MTNRTWSAERLFQLWFTTGDIIVGQIEDGRYQAALQSVQGVAFQADTPQTALCLLLSHLRKTGAARLGKGSGGE